MLDEAQRNTVAATTISHKSHAEEAQDHHGPGGGFGDSPGEMHCADCFRTALGVPKGCPDRENLVAGIGIDGVE
jgi:hypothetical protein